MASKTTSKPLSRMSKAELVKLAKSEGIDIDEGASRDDVYKQIRDDRGDHGPAPESEVPKEGRRAVRWREAAAAAAGPEPKRDLRIGLSQPRAENTLLTIDVAGAEPRASVSISLSRGRFPAGGSVTSLRADDEGETQVSIFPTEGELTITAKSGGNEATRTIEVAG